MDILFLVIVAVGFWEHSPGLIVFAFIALFTFDDIR